MIGMTRPRSVVTAVLAAWSLACVVDSTDEGTETSDTGASETETGDDESTTGEPESCEPAARVPAQDVGSADLGLLLADEAAPFAVHVGAVNRSRVHVAWIDRGDANAELHVVELDDGVVGSDDVFALSSVSAVTPAFDTDDEGTLYAAWVGSEGQLVLSARADGEDPTHTVVAASGVGEPTLALRGNRGVIVWYEGVYELKLARFDITGGGAVSLGAIEDVPHTVSRTFGVLAPHVGIDAAGIVRMSWDDIDPTSKTPDSPDVFMIQRSTSGSWTASFNISESIPFHSSESFVTLNDDGWHLVWVEQNHGADITNFEVWWSFESGGSFTTPVDVSREGLTTNILSPQWPRIEVDCSDDPRFGWFSRPADRPDASAIFHYAPDAISSFVPVFAAEMNRDAGWFVDGSGTHHFAWVSPASLTGTTGVRYLSVP
jgi:hypothetical protein